MIELGAKHMLPVIIASNKIIANIHRPLVQSLQTLRALNDSDAAEISLQSINTS